jgi:hypothetical protein
VRVETVNPHAGAVNRFLYSVGAVTALIGAEEKRALEAAKKESK